MRAVNRTRNSTLASAVQVADSSKDRRRGLLNRSGLSAEEGLLIRPCEAVHTFFMQFPIDVIFFNRQGQVVKIIPDLVPWRIAFCLRAHAVLELQAGTAGRTQLAVGDHIEFESGG